MVRHRDVSSGRDFDAGKILTGSSHLVADLVTPTSPNEIFFMSVKLLIVIDDQLFAASY